MGSFFRASLSNHLGWSFVLVTILGLGCASPVGFDLAAEEPVPDVSETKPAYIYFGAPMAGDLWSAKITAWQLRERESHLTQDLAPVSGEGEVVQDSPAPDADDLRARYQEFRVQQKRALARGVAEWVQQEAPSHYIPDGPIDHWATLEETLAHNGDDCDGLELLAFYLLRDLGFGQDEVFRAVVYRPSDGQHHMVTLWFEDTEDPWVIDPTGAMAKGMPRMSEESEWVPLKLFTDTGEYTVMKKPPPSSKPG